MPLTDNLWYLGAQFMAGIQARDARSARRRLDLILRLIARESRGRFSYYKLRTLQVLTNANRAAFNAGASTDALARHSLHIVEGIDRVATPAALVRLARRAVAATIALVPGGNAYQDRIVQEAITYTRDHLADALTRDQLAARLQCSPAHFSRTFARTTGYPFKHFLIQCRMEKAKELLENSRLQVAEIAGAVGYQDQFQFSRLFRRRVGVSPRQFRTSRHQPGPAAGAM
ncbi:MAG: helix-turn-helix transcriptional regulator [Opitutaceae bacterium]|nr:helix-turn-helix transcriptional regulator [Opitutaceae bacterium]